MQLPLDFESTRWPDHAAFPLNKKKGNTTVEDLIRKNLCNERNIGRY